MSLVMISMMILIMISHLLFHLGGTFDTAPPMSCVASVTARFYVMTSNVYERRRRDLSLFYRHQSGVSFVRETSLLRSAVRLLQPPATH